MIVLQQVGKNGCKKQQKKQRVMLQKNNLEAIGTTQIYKSIDSWEYQSGDCYLQLHKPTKRILFNGGWRASREF